jgi:undecaprenyl diphosphate synthase
MNLPKHIGIIMDGNGRWGMKNFASRIQGHKKGADVLIEIILQSLESDIEYLSVFAFSTENWKREKSEIDFLLTLPSVLYKIWENKFKSHDVRFKIIGDTSVFSPSVQKIIQKIETNSAHNSKLTVNVCFNYGGKQDIQFAMQKIAKQVENGAIDSTQITTDLIADNLFTAGQPDLDLIIRTSGEYRLSNFMLWQASYSEFYISDLNWPEFTRQEYIKAINSFINRERRYGGH